jgi:hypothetical protein
MRNYDVNPGNRFLLLKDTGIVRLTVGLNAAIQ